MTTALVTGASDGIGYELSKLLAARKMDLVLVARRQPRLEEVAAELQAAHGVRCWVLPCDLAQPNAAQRVFEQTQAWGIDVDFLVNNAGLLCNGEFHAFDRGRLQDMLAVNVLALTSLTHLFLQGMVARRSGYILNVASTAAWVGIPNQNAYAATKAYVLSFSLALADEMRAEGCGVRVTALCPSYTATRMLDNPEQGDKLSIPKALMLDAAFVARTGLDGCVRGKSLVIPGWTNRLSMFLVQWVPKPLITRVLGYFYRRVLRTTQAG